MYKKLLSFIGLALALALIMWLMMSRGWFLGFQSSLQNSFYDYDQATSEIVIVAIDEDSLKEDNLGNLSRWPRAYYAQAIEILNENKAAAIGIDITFPNRSTQGYQDDATLAETVDRYDNVVLATRYYFKDGVRQIEWPNASLQEVNPLYGWINIMLDEDGFVRQIPVFTESEEGAVDAFSLVLAGIYLHEKPLNYRVENGKFQYSSGLVIPVQSHLDPGLGDLVHLMYVNYFAEPERFTTISFSDLLAGHLMDNNGQPIDFRDKIVLIGPTAVDLQDQYLSPVSSGKMMSGVEIHANAIQTIIEGEFLRDQSDWSLIALLASLLILNLFFFSFMKLRYALPLVLGEWLVTIVLGILIYEYHILVNVVYPILMILMSFVGTYLLRFILEQKQRKFIEAAFGHYVNETVVEQIQKNPEMLKLGGDKHELTIFFSDISGFTSIAEKLKPEDLVRFLNEYLEAMTQIILENEGTLDKYEGDAIMAFWNAPLAEKDHALHACLSALENQKKLRELRVRWMAEGLPEMEVRIGINTGVAVVGNMGSTDRFDYTVMGDHVNLASRLEGINKQYGTQIMISQYTYAAIMDHLVCRELDEIRVKGKAEPVRIYELMAKKDEETPELKQKCEIFAKGLSLYRAKSFDQAKKEFEKLAEDGPAKVFVKRCEAFSKNPPPEKWDGVWNFEVK